MGCRQTMTHSPWKNLCTNNKGFIEGQAHMVTSQCSNTYRNFTRPICSNHISSHIRTWQLALSYCRHENIKGNPKGWHLLVWNGIIQ